MTNFKLSAEDKAIFDRDGVVCLRDVLGMTELVGLQNAVDQQIASVGQSPTAYDLESIAEQVWETRKNNVDIGDAARFAIDHFAAVIKSDPEARPLLDTRQDADQNGAFVYETSGWRRHREIREVAFDSHLPRIAAQLMDASVVNFWEDGSFVKAPHTRQKTAFHQDLGYNQFEGDQSVIFWVPLDPATLANGVTRYVRGSHKWGKEYAPNMFVSQTPMPGAQAPRCPDIEANEDDYDIVSFDVYPGDVIAHHVLTVHGAGGNPTDQMRRALSIHYCGDDVRYVDRPGASPRTYGQNLLKPGDRLLSPDHPVVWPRPWPDASIADLYDLQNAPPAKRAA
ncbi:MAG: phytanoyl-CoA dioxygenase family protein [Pseudomonadota bacterium]